MTDLESTMLAEIQTILRDLARLKYQAEELTGEISRVYGKIEDALDHLEGTDDWLPFVGRDDSE